MEFNSLKYHKLRPVSQEKKWVAEIIGEDPTFRLKRMFLPLYNDQSYHLFDGYYQIQGVFANQPPFEKEYCQVVDGRLQRHLSFRQINAQLRTIIAADPHRRERIKNQIINLLNELSQELNHDLVQELLVYQMDQLHDLEDSLMLNASLSQLLKQLGSIRHELKQKIQLFETESYF